ncbi:MAG: PqqD family protein [Ruminococcaceae bacterium]|nr:PqqD family protein [Oscillospiraceae bacterium]
MKLKYSFVVNEVAGQFVAVVVGDDIEKFSGFVKMNDVGADIFALLSEETTIDEVVAKLKEKYTEASDDEVRETVEEFTAKLRESGVLE